MTSIQAPRLAKRLGANLILASETFQHTGSFSFRAGYSVASRVPEEMLAVGIIVMGYQSVLRKYWTPDGVVASFVAAQRPGDPKLKA